MKGNTIISPRLIYFYALAALMLPNIALCLTEGMPMAACVANVLMPLPVYICLLSLSAKTGKTVWCLFPLIFLAAFQLVLLYLFGQGIISVDMFLNVVTSNPGEMAELLDRLLPAVVGVLSIYIPLLVIAAISLRRHLHIGADFQATARKAAAITAPLGVGALAWAWTTAPSYSPTDHLYPANVLYNLGLAVVRAHNSATYNERVADFTFGARTSHGDDSTEVYIMVIGETARASNFAIYGYNRPTTPRMSSMNGIVAFSRATTQSNTTHKSVPMLLSAASAADYSLLDRQKGIMQAFREADFKTLFLSNQRRNHSYIDFLASQADSCWYADSETSKGGMGYDSILLPHVRQALATCPGRLFIVLHTYGSHFCYRERYPREYSYFKPDIRDEAKAENREDLINAYDNSIRYTDHILGEIADMLQQSGRTAAMLYASDHGENIFDDERNLFLHASPSPSWQELHVPLVVWLSDAYSTRYAAQAKALAENSKKDVETSRSVFHTMTGMAGISMKGSDMTANLASPMYREKPRSYLTDHNTQTDAPFSAKLNPTYIPFCKKW